MEQSVWLLFVVAVLFQVLGWLVLYLVARDIFSRVLTRVSRLLLVSAACGISAAFVAWKLVDVAIRMKDLHLAGDGTIVTIGLLYDLLATFFALFTFWYGCSCVYLVARRACRKKETFIRVS